LRLLVDVGNSAVKWAFARVDGIAGGGAEFLDAFHGVSSRKTGAQHQHQCDNNDR